jgi:hypothetical protein
VEGDTKGNFSFFATIVAKGEKPMLILIATGKTDRSQAQFKRHKADEFDL